MPISTTHKLSRCGYFNSTDTAGIFINPVKDRDSAIDREFRLLKKFGPRADLIFYKRIYVSAASYFKGVLAAYLNNLRRAVIDPNNIVVYNKELLTTPTDKIQAIIGDIQKLQKKIFPKNFPFLQQFEITLPDRLKGLPLSELVRIILSRQSSKESKERAQYALQALEKIDPSLVALNNQIFCYVNSRIENVRIRAFVLLSNYTAQIPEYAKVLICPHPLSKVPLENDVEESEDRAKFWRLKKICLGDAPSPRNPRVSYLSNLQDIAKAEGIPSISVINMKDSEWLRDQFVILESGEIITPLYLCTGDFLLKYLKSLLNTSNENKLIGKVAKDDFSETLDGGKIPHTRANFYFEGGNLIPAIDQNGQKKYLCGASNILATLFNSHEVFSSAESKEALLEEAKKLEPEDAQLRLVRSRLEAAGLLFPWLPGEEKDFLCRLFLASANSVVEQMEETLECPVVVIGDLFDAPPDFHIDMFLAPAPGGKVYMQSDLRCLEVLANIKEKILLTEKESAQLLVYEESVRAKMAEEGVKMEEIAEQLSLAGFKVDFLPGNYESASGLPLVNMMNSLIGIGKNGPFCITNGSSNCFDHYLRDAFVSEICALGINNVYFVGKEQNELPFWKPGEYDISTLSLNSFGGIHCRTQDVPEAFSDFEFKQDPSFQALPQEHSDQNLLYFFQEMMRLDALKYQPFSWDDYLANVNVLEAKNS